MELRGLKEILVYIIEWAVIGWTVLFLVLLFKIAVLLFKIADEINTRKQKKEEV